MEKNDPIRVTELINLVLDAICVVNAKGTLLSINGACEHIFGYRPEEMIGKQIIEFVYHEDRERTLNQVDRIMNGYMQRYFENRYVRKDGSLVNIMWSARWHATENVRVAVARDVTNRSSAEPSEFIPETQPAWRLCSCPPQLIPPSQEPILLSNQDYVVMRTLFSGNEPVTRKAIIKALGKNYLDYDQRCLDTQMRRLRRKVAQACGLELPIKTLRGIGYRFYQQIEIHP